MPGGDMGAGERVEETKLKSCPFCGEKELLEVYAEPRGDREKCIWNAYVVCLICHGRASNHGFDWTEEEAKDKAIRAWNRRVGQIERIRGINRKRPKDFDKLTEKYRLK